MPPQNILRGLFIGYRETLLISFLIFSVAWHWIDDKILVFVARETVIITLPRDFFVALINFFRELVVVGNNYTLWQF